MQPSLSLLYAAYSHRPTSILRRPSPILPSISAPVSSSSTLPLVLTDVQHISALFLQQLFTTQPTSSPSSNITSLRPLLKETVSANQALVLRELQFPVSATVLFPANHPRVTSVVPLCDAGLRLIPSAIVVLDRYE
ncbi:unnamed protein product [Vicia faba]|uniref:Uncharacterized protein n=1 Tax=Vicia faba TaxID=3906 RepID=A0AAV1AHI1_VICFA|nr:unnamed protein product [Vicia faba]